ncbi:hypothetical protein Tco_0912733, partial [Tanacetum coccineum]
MLHVTPTPSHEVGESSAAGAARQDRPAIARDNPYSKAREELYGFVDTVDDRPVHRRLAVMIEIEAKMANDYARSDVMSLRTTVVAQSALVSELQSAYHRRQRVIS